MPLLSRKQIYDPLGLSKSESDFEEMLKSGKFTVTTPKETTSVGPVAPPPTPAPTFGLFDFSAESIANMENALRSAGMATPTAPTPTAPTPATEKPTDALPGETIRNIDLFGVPKAQAGEMSDEDILNSPLSDEENKLIDNLQTKGYGKTSIVQGIRMYRNGEIDVEGNQKTKEEPSAPFQPIPMAKPFFQASEEAFQFGTPDAPYKFLSELGKTLGNIPTSVWNTLAGLGNVAADIATSPIAGTERAISGMIEPIKETVKGYEEKGVLGGTEELLKRATKFGTEEPVMAITAGKGIKEAPKQIAALPGKVAAIPAALSETAKHMRELPKTGAIGKQLYRVGKTETGEEITLPEKGTLEKVKGKIFDKTPEALQKENALGETELSRLAGRAVMPESGGKSISSLLKKTAAPMQGLKQIWELVRTGKIEGDLTTMTGTAKAIVDALDKYGAKIGKLREKTMKDSLATEDLAGLVEDIANTKKPSIRNSKGFQNLVDYYTELKGTNNFSDIWRMRGDIAADMADLQRQGLAGKTTYQSLAKIQEALNNKIEQYLTKESGFKGKELADYKNAMQVYSNLMKVSKDFLKSTIVDSRRTSMPWQEQMALIQGGYMELLTNPIQAIGKEGMRQMAKEMARRGTREGHMQQFFDGLDSIAEAGAWKTTPPKATPPTPKAPTAPIGPKTTKKPTQ